MQVAYCHFPHWFLNMSRMTQKARFVPLSLNKAFMDWIEEETAGVSTENSVSLEHGEDIQRLEKRHLEEIKVVMPSNNKS